MPQAALKENPADMRGHNNPPPDIAGPTPFELSKKEIEDLYLEAKNWADGVSIENEAQAIAVRALQEKIVAAQQLADERRKVENKAFDDGKAAVQSKYNPLIADNKSVQGKTVMAIAALKKLLTPYLKRQENEKLAAAEKLRKEAEEATRKAQEAIRAADPTDLGAREDAEVLIVQAKAADKVATVAENSKAQVKGIGRSLGLHTTYRAEITDQWVFARWVWANHQHLLLEHMPAIAKTLVGQNIHKMDGVIVHADRSL